jgi:hypothetical protein
MRKIIAAVASVTAIAALVLPTIASADVARYQTTDSMTLVTHYNGIDFIHHYTITDNPCVDNSFTGVAKGGIVSGDGETIQGTFNGSNITVQGQYHNGSGYTWNYSGPLTGGGNGGDSLNLKWTVSMTTDTSNFKNHGQYVSSQGGGSDAAHSCIGMPINSSK